MGTDQTEHASAEALAPDVETPSHFDLKGGLFTLTSVQLYHAGLAGLSEQLEDKIKQAPKFFEHAPIVVDLQRMRSKDAEQLSFPDLMTILRDKRLVPVGIRGGSEAVKKTAVAQGLALLPESRQTQNRNTLTSRPERPARNTESKAATETSSSSPTRVITQPVRSGQQVYAPGGDLIVLAPVSQGAELLADGHIHVYGPMRGRALAGIGGDKQACIFCQSLEAELVSIAGHYKVSEDLKDNLWKMNVKIFLRDDHIEITKL